MVPALYHATVTHRRWQPVPRAFRHDVYLWLVDLDDLPLLPWFVRPLARFDSRDHLGQAHRSIRDNLDAWLASRGVDLAGGRVLMLTSPRVFGYTFNPLSVFWCHHPDGTLACVVAEVHNTHRERHCYLLHPDSEGTAETVKRFYVSPFLPQHGHYHLHLPSPGQQLALTVTLSHEDRTVFAASVHGSRRRATTREVLRTALRYPLLGHRVAALIRGHGIALWLRRAPYVSHKPHAPQKGLR